MGITLAIFFVGLLIFSAHFFTGLFEKARIPDVIPLVLIGLLIGPILGWIIPAHFGRVGDVFATITLIILLFQSGLGLNFSTLQKAILRSSALTAVNFLVTMFSVSIIAILVFWMRPMEAFILGAILGGTSSAVVIPMIEKLRVGERARMILFLESTLSDVLCIVVTLALLQAYQFAQINPQGVVTQILASFLFAAAMGAAAAMVWSILLNRIHQLENTIFTTPAFVFIIYALAELLGLSGAIASLAFGITLGNIFSMPLGTLQKFVSFRRVDLSGTEKIVFAELVFLLKTFFFVYIGLSIRVSNPLLFLGGFLITVVIFITRIPVVRFIFDKGMTKLEASIASVMVPKGLAAAVLALLPLQAGVTGGSLIQEIVYVVILFTIFATAILVYLIESGKLKEPYQTVFAQYVPEVEPTP